MTESTSLDDDAYRLGFVIGPGALVAEYLQAHCHLIHCRPFLRILRGQLLDQIYHLQMHIGAENRTRIQSGQVVRSACLAIYLTRC